jgi:hypothetical protein
MSAVQIGEIQNRHLKRFRESVEFFHALSLQELYGCVKLIIAAFGLLGASRRLALRFGDKGAVQVDFGKAGWGFAVRGVAIQRHGKDSANRAHECAQ